MKFRFWEKEVKNRDDWDLLGWLLLVPVLLIGGLVLLLRESGEAEAEREREKRFGHNRFISTRSGQAPEPAGQKGKENKMRAGQEPARGETQARDVRQDDLKVVEGIGPKTAKVLNEAGITTLRELADTPVERLNEILRGAGLRLNPPDTWPEQARLVADGQWDRFEDLKSRLHAGRLNKG